MYITKHKVNKSYTVYVCHENRKAARSHEPPKIPVKSKKKKLAEKTLLSPLSDRSLVKHKLYGMGEIIGTDVYGYMSVAFSSKTATFIYPDAFKEGFLVRA